jgi:sialidase-1
MRRLLAILAIGLTALLEPGAVGASAARAGSCSWTPFTSRMNSVRGPYYRVPSVVRARNGWLVAFAERRDNNGTRDDGNFDIVRSISTNNGCSWKAPKVLQDAGTHRVSNPLPILDAITGRIYLMTSVRTDKNYLYVSRSDTNGSTWTKPRRLVKPADGITGWRGGLTAPGNGIQLSSGPHKGRLLFSIGAVDHQGRYRVDVVASDDHPGTRTSSSRRSSSSAATPCSSPPTTSSPVTGSGPATGRSPPTAGRASVPTVS